MTAFPAPASVRRRLARLRPAAQLISSAPARNPADAVRSMLAMQAQDERGVKWSVGLRTTNATEADVAIQLSVAVISFYQPVAAASA